MASIRSQLLHQVFARLTQDTVLHPLFNLRGDDLGQEWSNDTDAELMQERVYYLAIEANPTHPYIVYGLDDKGGLGSYDDSFITHCRLYIDVWDYKPNHIRIDEIQDRIAKLFNRRECQLESGRASLRLETVFESPVQAASGDIEPDLGRYTVVFSVRLLDGSMVQAILEP